MVRASTSAARGSSLSSARSPKYSPVPTSLTSLPSTWHSTCVRVRVRVGVWVRLRLRLRLRDRVRAGIRLGCYLALLHDEELVTGLALPYDELGGRVLDFFELRDNSVPLRLR